MSPLFLATEYHRRWEVESTIDELKIHLLGRKTLIRSLNPREVVQEIYGWLLGHWAVRSLMFQVAESASISPLRLSFTGTLNIVRRAVPKFQRLQIEEIPFFSPGLSAKFWMSRSQNLKVEATLVLSKKPEPNFLLKSRYIEKQQLNYKHLLSLYLTPLRT